MSKLFDFQTMNNDDITLDFFNMDNCYHLCSYSINYFSAFFEHKMILVCFLVKMPSRARGIHNSVKEMIVM